MYDPLTAQLVCSTT